MKNVLVTLAVVAAMPVIGFASPNARITFHVADDHGNSVTNATIVLFNYDRGHLGDIPKGSSTPDFFKDRAKTEGLTDSNGCVTLTISSKNGDMFYLIQPAGGNVNTLRRTLGDGRQYYRDEGGRTQMKTPVDDKWQPWNSTVALVTKPVENPIAMYARNTGGGNPPLKIPAFDKLIGFDLIKSDWVSPYGKGENADFVFRYKASDSVGVPKAYYVENPRSGIFKDTDFCLLFSNTGDGLQCVIDNPRSDGSSFRLPRYALESGYSSNLVCSGRVLLNNGQIESVGDQWSESQNYFFRVRSQQDRNGSITNALYGKIRGPIKCLTDGRIEFTYYLNPTPNDRTMEYDPLRNLLAGKISAQEHPAGP